MADARDVEQEAANQKESTPIVTTTAQFSDEFSNESTQHDLGKAEAAGVLLSHQPLAPPPPYTETDQSAIGGAQQDDQHPMTFEHRESSSKTTQQASWTDTQQNQIEESGVHGHSEGSPTTAEQSTWTESSLPAPPIAGQSSYTESAQQVSTTEQYFPSADSPHDGMYEHLAEEQHLEAEDDDNDSAIGSDTESTTTTLSESIFNYRREHGRTYHAYKDGKYIFPNDEREADRLDLQHHLFYLTFAGKLHFAPISQPKHALDVGTGTGIWAVDFADQYPQCQVVGIDLSPGQPTMIPPNLKFVVDDAEDEWVYHNKLDYIHCRLMAGCFGDWANFFRQAYDNLEPGGWLELQDYGLPIKSADNTHQNTHISKWGELLCEAARKLGRPMGSDACDLYEEQMRAAGFVDVQQRMFMWPINGWPKDPYMKELGRWNQVNCLDGLEGFCLALLTRALGWKREEVDIFVALVTKDFKNKSIHAYFPMPVTFGRKPRLDEVW